MIENNNNKLVEEIEDFVINASSVSKFGNCVEKYNLHNYIFNNSTNNDNKNCYICVLLLPRTINAIQIVYERSNICYNDIVHARMSCFEANLITATMGNYLFKEKDSRPMSCEIDGIYDIEYHEIGSNVVCSNNKSLSIENCKYKDVLSLSFPNCHNSNIEKSYFCLGNFKDRELKEYTFLFDLETGKHTCARKIVTENAVKLYVGDTFDCINDINKKNVKEYTFIKQNSISNSTLCTFPEYLHGNYETFEIENNKLMYKKSTENFENLSSVCIKNQNNTFLVKTYAECGIPLAYNCFHFVMRSPSVVQIKIHGAQTNNIEECLSYLDYDDSFWVTASKNINFKSYCGFEGSWGTIFDNTSDRCFNVDVISPTFSTFNIVGFNCKENTIFQTKTYQCMGTWKENNKIYLYTKEYTNESTNITSNVCFIIQNVGNNKIMLTKVGSQCLQSFNVNQTLTLEQKLVEPSLISTPLIEISENFENGPQGNMNDLIDDEYNDTKILTQHDDHTTQLNKTIINFSSNKYYLLNNIIYIIIIIINL
uniref:C-type lectin domain-containing protein n=1 Tax=Strongyloides stercoralis TaxID=6248 RepID=A0A0K0EP35_STRER